MIEQLIAEATECDFKVALEIKKPKSWLKSVSAFSNGIGGTLFFGVSDDREPIGLSGSGGFSWPQHPILLQGRRRDGGIHPCWK